MSVDRAYKVLSNDVDRNVYDEFGAEGLEVLEHVRGAAHNNTSNSLSTQLGQYDEYADAVKEKVLRRLEYRREIADLRRYNHRGTLRIDVNAEEVVDGMPDAAVTVSQFVIQQSVEAKVTDRDTVFIQAYVVTRGGMGLGSVTFGSKRAISSATSGEVTCTFNTAAASPSLSLGARRMLSRDSNGAMFFVYRPEGHGIKLQCSRNLGHHTEGVLACGFGRRIRDIVQLGARNSVDVRVGPASRPKDEIRLLPRCA